MSAKLAMHGGAPVRKESWPSWPQATEEDWKNSVEPALKEVFMRQVEGLPGPKAKEFGEKFAAYCGAEYGICMPHGTDSIAAALSGALDLDGFGDSGEVIIPNYTFIATASAPLDRKCSVAFVDIDPDNFTIDPAAIEEAVDPSQTRAILPVHLGGHPANMDEINRIAEKYGLAVIEDCAQAHGAEYRGRKVGPLGSAGAFSFQSSKNLTSGEGGIVVTNDKDIYDRVYAFMNVGRRPGGERWEYPRVGWNYRPSEYLASLLLTRLEKLEYQTDLRNDNAAYLAKELKQIGGITTPQLNDWVTQHGYHLYMMKYDPEFFGGHPRDEFIQALQAEGISCTKGYASPLSKEAGLAHVAQKYPHLIRELPCPNTEQVCQQSVWFYQQMMLGTKQDMDDIVEAIAKIRRAFTS